MNYNEFKDYVKEHVLEYLPEQYKNANMDIRQAVKNNDVVLDGLTIFNPNGNMSPTIYLNAAYEEYQQGMDIEDVVGKSQMPILNISNQGRSIGLTLICRK